jgi:hypothetical protein
MPVAAERVRAEHQHNNGQAGQGVGEGGALMVSRKVLDERGVFTCDMDELREQCDEIHSTLTILATYADTAQESELLLALQGVARSVMALRLDVSEIDEVLRERGSIVDAHEYLRRQREQQQGRHLGREVQ